MSRKPGNIEQIAAGLSHTDTNIIADCAEVMTMVSKENPAVIKDYIADLIPLIYHKHTKVRWKALHCISLIVHLQPEATETILPDLELLVEKDKSTIVRDYATETLAGYAGINAHTAEKSFHYLWKILDQWKDKHASRVLAGMLKACMVLPALKSRLVPVAAEYEHSEKGVVRKAALKLKKQLEK